MGNYRYKVILIGDPAVGKTSLLYRYMSNEWKDNYAMTIGVQVLTKDYKFENNTVKLTLWDVGGQRRFKELRKNFYYGTQGAMLVFDLTRGETFKELDSWLKEAEDVVGEKVPFILIGNKNDLIKEQGRDINPKEAELYAKERNSIYIETSAKTGEKVNEAFANLTFLIAKKYGHVLEQ